MRNGESAITDRLRYTDLCRSTKGTPFPKRMTASPRPPPFATSSPTATPSAARQRSFGVASVAFLLARYFCRPDSGPYRSSRGQRAHPGRAPAELGEFVSKQSIWAIAAGVLFIILVTTLVDIVLHAVNVYPPMNQPLDDRLSVIATSYRIVIGVAGGWLTARLAPDRPMHHAMLLGYIGIVLGLIGVAATWNAGMGPRWYPMALVVLAVPQCWLGGRWYERQRRSK